jgi:hypothetical protein
MAGLEYEERVAACVRLQKRWCGNNQPGGPQLTSRISTAY